MLFLRGLFKKGQQHFELGTRVGLPRSVNQTRMASRLSQAQERFKNLNFGLIHAFELHLMEQSPAVGVSQLIIKLSLFRIEIAIEGLFNLLRQLGSDLSLGAA